MTTPKQRVALISAPGEARTALAEYLRRVGFDVHECAELVVPSSFAALVVIAEHETVETDVRAWMKRTKQQRVVVVTSKPTVLKALVTIHGERLCVLPAPVFGWDVADVLRARSPSGPRGA